MDLSHVTKSSIPQNAFLKTCETAQVATLLDGTQLIIDGQKTTDQPTIPELTTPSMQELLLPDLPPIEIPKPVIPQVKPQAQASDRILDCIVTLDQKSLGILALSSAAIGAERLKRTKQLIDRRAKNRLQRLKIEEQCRRSEERIHDVFVVQGLCQHFPEFNHKLNHEFARVIDIFESALLQSSSPDVIARQLELVYYPAGYEISEAHPGFFEGFRTTLQKLQNLLFNSSGRFTGITTPAQQKIAAEIYAEFLHKCSLVGTVFDAQKYLNKLQECVKKGLPYFAEIYAQALNNTKLSRWKSGHKATWFPNDLAQKIVQNTFNHDLKTLIELLIADPEDTQGTLPYCTDLVAPYASAAQNISWYDFVSDAQDQYVLLQKLLDDVYSRSYTPEGIRTCYLEDPLVPRLIDAIKNKDIVSAVANALLDLRKQACEAVIDVLGVPEEQVTQPLLDIVFGIVDHGADLKNIPAYLETQVGDTAQDPAKRDLKTLFFDKQGLPRIFRYPHSVPMGPSPLLHNPTQQPHVSEYPDTHKPLQVPQNPAQPTVPCDMPVSETPPLTETPKPTEQPPHTVPQLPPLEKPDSFNDSPQFPSVPQGTVPPVENSVQFPVVTNQELPGNEQPPHDDKNSQLSHNPQQQPSASRNPFAQTLAYFVDYIRKNPYKACELAIVSAAIYDDFLDHLRYGDDYADDIGDEDDVAELCENMFGDYLTKEQLDDLIQKLKGTMLFKGSGNGNGSGNGGNNGENGGGGNGDDPHNRNCGNQKMPSKPPKLPPLLAAMYKFWKKNKQKYDNLPGTKIKAPKINGAQVPKNQRYSSKNAQHNYKHYFSPDVKPYAKKGSGFHLNSNGMFNKVLEFRNKTDYKHGFYTAEWKYGNLKYKFSSFWPDTWSYKKVLKKIVEAAANQIEKPSWSKGALMVKGKIKEGYVIEIIYEVDQITRLATGKIITAYPVLKPLG